MKLFQLICYLTLGIVAVLATFVAAISDEVYKVIFTAVAILGGVSIAGFFYLALTSSSYRYYAIVLMALPIYAVFDVAFRYYWGVRVLDFLR